MSERTDVYNIKINYYKASFKTVPLTSEIIKKFFQRKKTLWTASFPEYEKIKVTLMGRFFEYVNVTGSKTFCEIENFSIFFCDKFNVHIVNPVKIDSISAGTHMKKLQQNCSFGIRQKLCDSGFTLKDNYKFPGLVLRNSKEFGNSVCIYFRTSGKLNFCGFKNISDIVKMCRAIEDAI